ncbi:MAG TPA: hypothetical protein VIV57_20210, partial [Anaeromyxobacter sp.]
MLRAALVAVVSLAALQDAPGNPCRAARAPLPASASLSAADRAPVEAYRAAWRRACDPGAGVADLGSLFGDAEALAEDVTTSPALEAIASALPPGAEWPLPALRREGGGPLRVDWASFGSASGRGTAEDGRFWRGAAVAAGPFGEPSWWGEALSRGPGRCLRLAETRWRDVADALDAMERGGSATYSRHVKALRARLLETLSSLARDREVCSCLPGDAAAALEPLA